ncbi:MAG: ATP-binding cassette domain-containing protein [Syntrophaceae bacterium]
MPPVNPHTHELRDHIVVQDLTLAYGKRVLLENISFAVKRGEVFIIMGGNGCGKSTLLKILIGLKQPASGQVFYNGISFWDADLEARESILQRIGILYQHNALWSSMTIGENVALPLQEYTDLIPKRIAEVVSLKLALVGLSGYESFYPAELSGGMQKRAALARAMALDPEILFFDEPSAGLDPINARLLDDLIIELSLSLKTTVVVITHDLDSIFTIGGHAILLDRQTRSILARGTPHDLLRLSTDPKVISFLNRGRTSREPSPRCADVHGDISDRKDDQP